MNLLKIIMVKVMNTNKITVIFSTIIIILIISIPTIYKVIKNHNNSLYQVVEDKIIEAAEKCYYEEKCLTDTILLKDLYELKYLEKINNPITKEYYNEESYVKRENNKFSFIAKE